MADPMMVKCDKCGKEVQVHNRSLRSIECACGIVTTVPEEIGWGLVLLSGLIPALGLIIAIAKLADGQRKTALACLVSALSVALVGAAILLPALERSRSAAQRAFCQNNLKQLGLIFKMYARECKGQYPLLDRDSPQPMFMCSELYPEYMTDVTVMFCPGDATGAHKLDVDALYEGKEDTKMTDSEWMKELSRFADEKTSYYYLGYAITTEEKGVTFVEAYRAAVKENQAFDHDLEVSTATGTLHRLREGVERFFITDINNPAAPSAFQSRIPLWSKSPAITNRTAETYCSWMATSNLCRWVRFR